MSKATRQQCNDKCVLRNIRIINNNYRKNTSKGYINKKNHMERSNKKTEEHTAWNQTQSYFCLETNKDKIQTWNHLAWRRDAKAVRHFCLSRTSGGSLTESDSIGRWNKKTRYSLTKGSSVIRPGGTQAAFPTTGRRGKGKGTPPLQNHQTLSTSQFKWFGTTRHT